METFKAGFKGGDEMRSKAERMLRELSHTSIYERYMNGERERSGHHNYEANMRGERPVAKTQKDGRHP